jgi:osmotically-inducible protein OsmY
MLHSKFVNRTRLSLIIILALFLGVNFKLLAFNDSSSLSQRVTNAISNNYYQNFNITTEGNGIVRIEGQVNSLYDKYNIFDIVSRVPGVKGIDDFITVNAPILPNGMIKDGIIFNLKLDNSILEPNRIKVNVVGDGIVILSGKVSYNSEKIQAETVASWEKGATGIVNQIKVLPRRIAYSSKNLRKVVHDVIKDDFPLDNHVHFSVKKGVVTLLGHTHDLWGINHLPKDCYEIKGIKKVVDDIRSVA